MKRHVICGFSQQNEYLLKALTLLSTNMSSDFSSAVQKLSKRILKKSKIVIFFLLLSSSSSSSSSSPVRLTREPLGVHRRKRYQNVSLSLARCNGCLKMPGDEKKKKSKTMHAQLGWPLPPLSCISRTTTRRGINKIPKCFSCPGDCKELSTKTKRSTYDSNQARTKPWPTRRPTSDNNSPITKRIRTNETQNVSLTLATVEDCRRKQGDGTVGTRAVVC